MNNNTYKYIIYIFCTFSPLSIVHYGSTLHLFIPVFFLFLIPRVLVLVLSLVFCFEVWRRSGFVRGSFSGSRSFMRLRLGVHFVLWVPPGDDASYCFILGFTGSFDASGFKGSLRLHLGFGGSFRCWFTRCRLLRLGRMS